MTQKLSQKKVVSPDLLFSSIDPLRLMAQLPIQSHHILADFQCGDGHFTIPIAKHLFGGTVYASDPLHKNLKDLREKVVRSRLGNLVIQTENQRSKNIPKKSLDGIFLPFLLHSTNERKDLLAKTLKLIKKGGWVGILEWFDRKTLDGPPVSERIGIDEIVRLGQEVGFSFPIKRILDDQHYVVILRN
jgi:ubiquinone/menaquinone biosynthesis C-methylase UbiE